MRGHLTASEFDQISDVYDATREPLAPVVVDRVATLLQDWGFRRLLEVGVGTGRVAVPLASRGFEVTGVDTSRGMLSRAREKGVSRLIRGSAYRLPLSDRALDGALFVHVLHVLDDPARAIAEACRTTRRGAAALVRPATGGASESEQLPNPRRLVVDLLRKDGVDLPDRAAGGPPRAERRLLDEHPPDGLKTVYEEDVTERLADELEILEKRASRWTLRVPPEKLGRAVAAAREAVGDQVRTYHRVQALALWERPPQARNVRPPDAGSPPTPG